MKSKPGKFLEQYRLQSGEFASDESYGMNGVFDIPCPTRGGTLAMQVSDRDDWDHVSVHVNITGFGHKQMQRCPTWNEMDYVRKLFFRGDEWVMQLHAPVDKHINQHPFTLHMWRPQNETIPVPPRKFV